MKAITTKNIEDFNFEILTRNELNELRGGGQPNSRDKDIYEFEED
ncbi:hypothetical protein [Draconibacterium sediminis]|mgnify:CR=1 FL=1|nr:hypothetical protein [Draconibacterium sediminis]